MRMRFRWLACVLLLGLWWMPSPVYAQLGTGEPTPWPQFPTPLRDGNKETGLYFASEVLFMRMDNPLGRQSLALRGVMDFDGTITGTAGAFIGSGAEALKASDASVERWTPGYRFTLGYRFEDDWSIYLSGFKIVENRRSTSAGIIPGNFNVRPDFADSFLFAPFFNFSPFFAGPDEDVLSQVSGNPTIAYGIGNGTDNMDITFQQSAWSWEITGKWPVQLIDGCRTYCLLGPRFMHLEEHFKFRLTDLTLDGELLNENVAIYRNEWVNRFLGVQTGWGLEKYLGGGFAVTAEARAGIFADVRKTKNQFERGDRGITAVMHSQKQDSVGVSPMFQLGIFLEWLPVEGVQFRAGYEFMGVFNTLRSSFPVDFNIGSLAPEYERKWWRLDGFSVGVAIIF